MSGVEQPFVSVLMPVFNEEQHLARCLDSILAGDYPRDRLEILVIDGMSTDQSALIAQHYAATHSLIRLLTNPKRIQAAALNIGIRESKGEIIVRMDAHALYAPDYIRTCVQLLRNHPEAANVGGPQRAVGTDYVSDCIAVAITTPFGIGDASFRYSQKEEWVDSVYLGAWRKSTLIALGGFREEWAVNEDYELNYRLRRAGGKILLSPQIRCCYHVRPSLRALARQYFRYGFWKAKTLSTHPYSLRWRQMAPPALVLALVFSTPSLAIDRRAAALAPMLYALAALGGSVLTARRRGWEYLPLLPIVFATIHLAWGTGFLCGLLRWGLPKCGRSASRALRSLQRARSR